MAQRRRPARRSSRAAPVRNPVRRSEIFIVDAAVAPGTTRLTNLSSTLESDLVGDLMGGKILMVRGQGNIIGAAAAAQSYTYALFIGPATLDVADVLPRTDAGGFPWWVHRTVLHRGQAHQLTAGNEFDDIPLRFSTRGSRRMPSAMGAALWFAEESLAGTPNATWHLSVRYSA